MINPEYGVQAKEPEITTSLSPKDAINDIDALGSNGTINHLQMFNKHNYISLDVANNVLHFRNGDKTKPTVVLHKNSIRVGCSTISIEAIKYLLRKHEEAFSITKPKVLQD